MYMVAGSSIGLESVPMLKLPPSSTSNPNVLAGWKLYHINPLVLSESYMGMLLLGVLGDSKQNELHSGTQQ